MYESLPLSGQQRGCEFVAMVGRTRRRWGLTDDGFCEDQCVLAAGRMFAAAADFHHASLVCVFTILTAILLSLLNYTIASPMATLMFPVIGHKTPFQI
jgi:hypothetical protein